VALKTGDNITTDDIMPAGAKILPLRSNIPRISEFVFVNIDESFAEKAKASGSSIIVGGSNYGQGSSREHAALAPMFLGVKVVLAKSFARIHKDNLINFGILPLVITDDIYDSLNADDEMSFPEVAKDIRESSEVVMVNEKSGKEHKVEHHLTEREREAMLAGGTRNYIKKKKAV
jgi:aconitate hydratase